MGAFRILTRASGGGGSDRGDVEIAGHRWSIVPHPFPTASSDVPSYVCISYAWGDRRTPHILDPERDMPDRTIRVVEATLTAFASRALWVDAVCVPLEDPERSECLRSLGAIYSAAAMVVVVLSGAAEEVLDELTATESLSEEALLALEADDWVSRAWTYQELVNAIDVYFIGERGEGRPVSATRLFNAVGERMEKFRKSHGLDQWELRQLHPRLDGLESLIGDWQLSAYARRSAFRVMGSMANRSTVHPDELYYAMIGAITTDPARDPEDQNAPATEYFMRACERKGDFSFVYTSGDRDRPSWRPAPGPLPPLLSWHSDGDAQTGELDGRRLRLHHMALAEPGEIAEAARKFLDGALRALGVDLALPGPAVPAAILDSLRRAGFAGCGEHVELDSGYFFPVRHVPPERTWTVYIATEIFWTFGAPALLITSTTGSNVIVDVGVVVGRVPADGVTLDLD
jgi:hypothetical protein